MRSLVHNNLNRANLNSNKFNYIKNFSLKSFVTKDSLLQNCTINIYNGVELDLEKIMVNNNSRQNFENFPEILEHSLNRWNHNSVSSITVRIPSTLTEYLKIFLEKDFYFHHTRGNALYLCKWTDKKSRDKIPTFAHHHVGIGACILNQNIEFLLIREKFSPSYANANPRKHLWKFVTGLIEEGESVVQATQREVKEEVNMEVDYQGCLTFSESYPNNQQISDICFFNLCTIKNELPSYTNIEIDKEELSEAKFFKIDEVIKLLSEEETTLLTMSTLNKLIPLIDFKKSLPENINHIKSKGIFLSREVDLKNLNLKINYLNVFH